jgi:hypothetical protein
MCCVRLCLQCAHCAELLSPPLVPRNHPLLEQVCILFEVGCVCHSMCHVRLCPCVCSVIMRRNAGIMRSTQVPSFPHGMTYRWSSVFSLGSRMRHMRRLRLQVGCRRTALTAKTAPSRVVRTIFHWVWTMHSVTWISPRCCRRISPGPAVQVPGQLPAVHAN